MKKFPIIALLAWFVGAGTMEVRAQDKALVVSVGLADMRMDDMKYLLETIMETYPVEAKVISSFPPFTSTSVGALMQLYPQIRLGAAYGFATSGTKADYSDYSGYLRTTITAKSHKLGVYASYIPLAGEHLEFSLIGRFDLNLTLMEVNSSISAASFFNGLTDKYRGISPQGSVWADLMFRFGKASVGLEGGYLVDLPGKLKSTQGGDKLTDPNDFRRELTSDWTGWRAGIKFFYWLDSPSE
jgi:hypothetical protein